MAAEVTVGIMPFIFLLRGGTIRTNLLKDPFVIVWEGHAVRGLCS
jgi:hypothetical protein